MKIAQLSYKRNRFYVTTVLALGSVNLNSAFTNVLHPCSSQTTDTLKNPSQSLTLQGIVEYIQG